MSNDLVACYLLGSYLVSIASGLLVVFLLQARARCIPPSTGSARWRTSSLACRAASSPSSWGPDATGRGASGDSSERRRSSAPMPVVATVALVVLFCVMQQMFLEVPLIGYVFAPERAQDAVSRFRAWMGRRGRTAVVIGGSVIAIWLLIRGFRTI